MNFSYNLLNLPREVSYWAGANAKIKYYYTFDGEKLRKTVENSGTVTKVDYCGPFVYETASGVRSLKYFVTPEGRAVKNGSTWDYEYNLKDHLGNTRVVIRKGGSGLAEVIQERHYYPFGMEMSELSYGTGTNKYLYNSKEIQNDFDLYWYDYGARFYDPMLGRFHSIDPLAEKFSFQTPYSYGANNPILNIDVNGEYFLKYSAKNGGNYVAHVTNHSWINKVSRLSAIPYAGLVFEASLWGARGQDPSFKANAGDYAGLAIKAVGAGILKLAKDIGKAEGLGSFLLQSNREILYSSLTLMNEPSTKEIGIDYLAVKSLADEGIGKFYEDKSGKEMTSKFYFDKKYVKNVEKEIMADKELTLKKGFNLKNEVQNRLNQALEDKKSEIRSFFEDE
jgi:RHS repeat-associated protein